MENTKILITGALGQIGSILSKNLIEKYGHSSVILSDVESSKTFDNIENIDVSDFKRVDEVIRDYKITEVYHMAAILSAKGEKNPKQVWDINMGGLINILDSSMKNKVAKVFFPSSIAVFGSNIDPHNCLQHNPQQPTTLYGISKSAGEMWCQYYFDKYDLDVRSLRYPGIVGPDSLPGGGTTDYAVEIFHKILKTGQYTCYLSADTSLPMMYMDDAIYATLELMQADKNQIRIRSSYNIQGVTFSPAKLFDEIKKHIPDCQIHYQSDYRQNIAEFWPEKMNDMEAQIDWGWQPKFELSTIVTSMIEKLKI